MALTRSAKHAISCQSLEYTWQPEYCQAPFWGVYQCESSIFALWSYRSPAKALTNIGLRLSPLVGERKGSGVVLFQINYCGANFLRLTHLRPGYQGFVFPERGKMRKAAGARRVSCANRGDFGHTSGYIYDTGENS